MSTTPLPVADFQTTLNASVTAGATTATLLSALDSDGVTLPNGTVGFTIDGDISSSKEYFLATVSGTALTAIQSVSRQGVVTTGFARNHRYGAKVKITDWAVLSTIAGVLNGSASLDPNAHVKYSSAPVGLTGNELATVAYVLGVVTGGTVVFDQQVINSQTAGETFTAPCPVYLKESDNRWYKVLANTTTTFAGLKRGIAIVSGTASSNITVALSGPVSGFSALSVGQKYYATDAGTAISTAPGTNSVFLGWALTATKLLLAQNDKTVPTQIEKDFLGAVTGMYAYFASPNIPSGFLLCDGGTYNNSAYPNLAAFLAGWHGLGSLTLFTNTGNTLTATSHGFTAGQLLLASGGGLPTGMSQNTPYYVISPATNTFQLSLTPGGASITLSTNASGSVSPQFKVPDRRGRMIIGAGAVTKVATFASRASDTITVTGLTANANNEFQTGQAVTYNTSGSVITGLTNATVYYLIRVTNTSFKLASTLANAQNGTQIVLTSDGTGTQTFTLTLTTRTVGDTGGEENHAMSSTELLAHTHFASTNTSVSNSGLASSAGANFGIVPTTSTGGNAAMSVMNPFGVDYICIKT